MNLLPGQGETIDAIKRLGGWDQTPAPRSVIEKRGGYTPNTGQQRPTTPPPKPSDASRSAVPPWARKESR